MEPIVKHFFRFSFLCLFTGIFIDLYANFKLYKGWNKLSDIPPYFTHASNFLYIHGFLFLALAGFIYHMLPKLMGSFLWSKSLMGFHLFLVIIGIPTVTLFHFNSLFVRAGIKFTPEKFIIFPLAIVYLGSILFIFNILKSFNFKGKN
jgi:hypothetical protein